MPDQLTITAIFTGIGTVLGIALSKGVDAIVTYRKQATGETELINARADKAYQVVITKFEQRIESLENEVVVLRQAYDLESRARQKEHEECIRTTAKLQAEVDALKRQVKE